MQKSLFEVNGISSLGSADGEDLTPKDAINTTPPPDEYCCDCCGRPESELKPFSNIEGDLLRKTFRSYGLFIDVVHNINIKFFDKCITHEDKQKAMKKLVQKYGKTKAERIINLEYAAAHLLKSFECIDCISLNNFQYFERCIHNFDQLERCDCCGRHLCELSPFIEGDPVMDYFNGKLLARRYRPDAPPIEGLNKMMDEFFGNCITYEDHEKAQEELIQKYGLEEAKKLWTFAFCLDDLFKKSWECKDCIALDTHQYFGKKVAQESDSTHNSSG
jgi:hypothetical protein